MCNCKSQVVCCPLSGRTPGQGSSAQPFTTTIQANIQENTKLIENLLNGSKLVRSRGVGWTRGECCDGLYSSPGADEMRVIRITSSSADWEQQVSWPVPPGGATRAHQGVSQSKTDEGVPADTWTSWVENKKLDYILWSVLTTFNKKRNLPTRSIIKVWLSETNPFLILTYSTLQS